MRFFMPAIIEFLILFVEECYLVELKVCVIFSLVPSFRNGLLGPCVPYHADLDLDRELDLASTEWNPKTVAMMDR